MEHKKYKVGYVDEESRWINKFKLTMKEAFEIATFKLDQGITLEHLLNLIYDANLDCLVVDFELTETAVVPFYGNEVVEELRKRYPLFPVFIITSKDEKAVLEQVEDNEIVRLKDELTDKPLVLIQRIENKISNYYAEIHKANQTIYELTEKKNNGAALTPLEQDELFQKHLFLEKVYPDEKIIPDSLAAPETVNVIATFVEETKKALEELKKYEK